MGDQSEKKENQAPTALYGSSFCRVFQIIVIILYWMLADTLFL